MEYCPNCQAIWGLEELDWGQCDACGYPHHADDEDPDEMDEDCPSEDYELPYEPIS